MDRDFAMPLPLRAGFERDARAWLDAPAQRSQVEPRRSASVLLLRDGVWPGSVEVFLQRRVAGMAFAPSMLVYPGGGVDPRDADGPIRWPGARVGEQSWADRWGTTAATARLVLLAATRELFEECGVLFAGRCSGDLVTDLDAPRWRAYRAGLVERSVSFAHVLSIESLTLRTDLLTPVARWITPECEPRRYDTYFFAARMPAGQQADDRTTETVSSGWVDADSAVREHRQGPGTMMPPTQVLAEQIASATSVSDYLDTPRSLQPVLPWPVDDAGVLSMRVRLGGEGD